MSTHNGPREDLHMDTRKKSSTNHANGQEMAEKLESRVLLIIIECKVLSCALDQAMIWREWLSYPWLTLRNENGREGVPFLNRFPAT